MSNWITKISQKGLPYYFNIDSRRSQWKKPENFIPEIEIPYTRKHFVGNWYVVLSNYDRSFYWNKETKETQWESPELLDHPIVEEDYTLNVDVCIVKKQKQAEKDLFWTKLSTLNIDRYTAWDSVKDQCEIICPALSISEKRKIFDKFASENVVESPIDLDFYFEKEFLPRIVLDKKILWKQVDAKMKQDPFLRKCKKSPKQFEEIFKKHLRSL